MRRTELGKSQADVAFDSGELTQTTVSELERGKYGPEHLTAFRLAALARGLNWTIPELEKVTGLELGIYTETLDVATDDDGRTIAVFRNPPPPRLRPIPSELAEMIEEKSHLAEELQTERWQQYLAGQRFSTGRATPERWWNLFLLLKNAGVEPGGN
ncbi:hypothetical protein GCM10017784_30540 [Deinococcus indicus]|nr:hypothetical protein GCM10017784_30540 [Deinococcus indicus]